MAPYDEESTTPRNDDPQTRTKRPYTPPALERLGTIRELTLGLGMSGTFDQTNPPGQNKSFV